MSEIWKYEYAYGILHGLELVLGLTDRFDGDSVGYVHSERVIVL